MGRTSFINGLSPSEIDVGDAIDVPINNGPKYTHMDTCSWRLTGEAKTHPSGHITSEVDWGGHDPNPNHINEPLLSEVDWGAHDSSVFLFWQILIMMQNQMNHVSKDYWENYKIEHPPFLSLGSKLILWLLDKLKMIFSTPHHLTQT